MRRAALNTDPDTLIRRLFELKGLDKDSAVEQITLETLKKIVAEDLQGLHKKIQEEALLGELPKEKAYLKAATQTPDYATFKGHLDLAMQKGDMTAFNLMADKALNYQHFVDVCTQKVMATNPKSQALTYSQVFNTLKNEHFTQLEDSVAALRAGQNVLDVLNSSHGQGVLKHFKAMYTYSASAMKEVDALDAAIKRLQSDGAKHLKASFNFLGTKVPLPALDWVKKTLKLPTLESLEVRRILSESARNMRSPIDSIGYVLVAAVIGFFPVWLNQVVTETEYRFKKAKDAPPKKEESH
jgi:ligand-binding SRPBCC domain-containing protein